MKSSQNYPTNYDFTSRPLYLGSANNLNNLNSSNYDNGLINLNNELSVNAAQATTFQQQSSSSSSKHQLHYNNSLSYHHPSTSASTKLQSSQRSVVIATPPLTSNYSRTATAQTQTTSTKPSKYEQHSKIIGSSVIEESDVNNYQIVKVESPNNNYQQQNQQPDHTKKRKRETGGHNYPIYHILLFYSLFYLP